MSALPSWGVGGDRETLARDRERCMRECWKRGQLLRERANRRERQKGPSTGDVKDGRSLLLEETPAAAHW